MGKHLDRALVLFEQSRHDLAERELRQELAADPDNPMAHALLALCLSAREQYAEATREAQQAVARAPDQPFMHYALGRVCYDRDRYDEAEQAVEEALRLDPESADSYALLSGIHFEQRRWATALEVAEEGLAIDPEHTGLNNLRAMALVKLGRRDEAGATIREALAREPENALTHANQGWALMHARDYKRAMEHFREALRLDPELDWARAGIVEALKARNPVYGLMLRYFLWMATLSGRAQWAVIIGAYVGYRVLGSIADKNPGLAPWIRPVLILYVAFAVMTWIASPLFNLLLRLNRFGRLALSREQVVASNCVGATLLAAVAALAAWPLTGNEGFQTLALVIGFLVMPVAGTFQLPAGWPRWVMAGYTTLLALVGGGASLLFLQGGKGDGLLGLFFLGILLAAFLANGLAMARPSR